MSEQVIGFVGAGQMGLPMVSRLAAAGYAPLTLARRPEAVDAVAAVGGRPVATTAGLAAADIVIVCVFSADQVDDVVLGDDGLLAHLRPGAAIVSHVTAARADVERVAAAAAAAGVDYLDAPISGAAQAISEGRLTVLVGGDDQVAARCEPALGTYSSTIRRTGPVGTATALKLINNALFGANIQLAATAVLLAENEGVALADAMDALGHCSGASAALSYMQAFGGPEPFAAGVLPYLRKDIAAVRTDARSSGRDLGVIDSAIADGPLTLV